MTNLSAAAVLWTLGNFKLSPRLPFVSIVLYKCHFDIFFKMCYDDQLSLIARRERASEDARKLIFNKRGVNVLKSYILCYSFKRQLCEAVNCVGTRRRPLFIVC